MPHSPQKLLEDIRIDVDRVERFRKGRTFDDFVADDMFRFAVERQFEIMGEAISRLKRVDASIVDRIADSRRIVAFRNIIRHGYDAVRNGDVWNIIEQHLPPLLKTVEEMLAAYPEPDVTRPPPPTDPPTP